MMTVAKLIRLLLELDQQCVSPRPSLFGEGVELVRMLADHAEPSIRNPDLMGDWEAIDVSQVRKRVGGNLNQPILNTMDE
jgi:hypothetical protein